MAGLLSEIFSAGNVAKRKLTDLLGNPLESAQQILGNMNDRARVLNEMTSAAAREGVAYGPASQQLGGLLSEAYNPVGMTTYRGSHKAPNPDFGAPLHDLTGGGQMYPADVYSSKAVQFYGTGYPKADKEAFSLANKVRGNPDAEVTMYRAVPKDESISSINKGDWVTLSKDYAQNHGESVLGNNYKIISQKVKAKDLWTNADSIQEFGYWPE